MSWSDHETASLSLELASAGAPVQTGSFHLFLPRHMPDYTALIGSG